MPGRDVAARFWQDNPRLPVVFICDSAQELMDRNDEAGRSVIYLSKPYSPDQLIQGVRDSLAGVLAARRARLATAFLT